MRAPANLEDCCNKLIQDHYMRDSISGVHIIILSSQGYLIYVLNIVNVHARCSTFTLVSLSVWQANLHGADK